jgi:hypothetical protein
MVITRAFGQRYIFLLSTIFCLSSCGILGPQQFDLPTKNDKSSDVYFISMDEGNCRSIEEAMQDSMIRADIWVEPRDQEISTFGDSFANKNHVGQKTHVAIIEDKPFKELKELPRQVNWRAHINQDAIQKGLVFIVRSSSGAHYKAMIESYNDQKLTLVYKAF